MPNQTRKNRKTCDTKKNIDPHCKLKLKSCKAALYKSVYGGTAGGNIRTPLHATFY
jgi:hypothetical protein